MAEAPDPNAPQTPPAPTPASAAPPASGEISPVGNSPPEPGTSPAAASAATPDWRDDRLRVQSARFHQEKQRADALEAELTQLRAAANPSQRQVPGASQAEIAAAIDQQANIKAANLRFNEDCNRIVEEGRKEFGAEEFDASVGQLARLLTPGDDQSTNAYMTMISAAIRSGKGAEVVNKLGKDLRSAQRIMSMDPMGMAAEVTKIATGAIKTEVSGAPKPITPVSTRASGLQDIDPGDPERQGNLTTTEWMKRRNAQVEKQGSSRGSRFR